MSGPTLAGWDDLARRLRSLVEKHGGPAKSSDGEMAVCWAGDGRVSVTIGAYSLGDWPRHFTIGEFDSDEQARAALSATLDKADQFPVEGEEVARA